MDLGFRLWVQIPVLLFKNCVTLDNMLNKNTWVFVILLNNIFNLAGHKPSRVTNIPLLTSVLSIFFLTVQEAVIPCQDFATFPGISLVVSKFATEVSKCFTKLCFSSFHLKKRLYLSLLFRRKAWNQIIRIKQAKGVIVGWTVLLSEFKC